MSNNKIISFEMYETIGVGRGPVGLEPMFRIIDEQLVTEQDLQNCINAYRQHDIDENQLLQVFAKLARLIHILPDEIIKESANLCLKELENYDSATSTYFNYFTNIIFNNENHYCR